MPHSLPFHRLKQEETHRTTKKNCQNTRARQAGRWTDNVEGDLCLIPLPQPCSSDLPDITQFLSIYLSEEDLIVIQVSDVRSPQHKTSHGVW